MNILLWLIKNTSVFRILVVEVKIYLFSTCCNHVMLVDTKNYVRCPYLFLVNNYFIFIFLYLIRTKKQFLLLLNNHGTSVATVPSLSIGVCVGWGGGGGVAIVKPNCAAALLPCI